MELPVELQLHVLEYLSDKTLYRLAGPRGLGAAAFNRLHRVLSVVERAEFTIGTPDFAVEATRVVFSARELVDFCKRHPYFKPHTIDFVSLDQYLEAVSLAPEILQAAARIELRFDDTSRCHPQLVHAGSPEMPGLWANVRRYGCDSTSSFETVAKNLSRYLPQLEEFSYEYRMEAMFGVWEQAVHRCDFDHPTLRKLTLNGPGDDIKYFVVRLPQGLREFVVSSADLQFSNAVLMNSLTRLTVTTVKFGGNVADLMPRLQSLTVNRGRAVGACTELFGQLRELSIIGLTRQQFSDSRLSASLTHLEIMFDDQNEQTSVVFRHEYPHLRELTLYYLGPHRPVSDIRISGRFPKSLEFLYLSDCVFDAKKSGFDQLDSLHSLHMSTCAVDSFKFPASLTGCWFQNNDISSVTFPPRLRELTFVDDKAVCNVEFNAALESLTLNVTQGRRYALPDLKTLVLQVSIMTGAFELKPELLALPTSLTSLEIKRLGAWALSFPPALVNLSLLDCGISKFPVLPHVESLGLTHNPVALPATLPPTLRSLNVLGCYATAGLDWSKSNLEYLATGDTGLYRIKLPPSLKVAASKHRESLVAGSPHTVFVESW